MMIRSLPDSGGTWRRVVDASTGASLPHAPEWLPIIQGAYGHDPFYLSAEDDSGGCAILPAFVVRRPLLGAVVTSMPFLDGGGPCGSPSLGRILLEHLIAEARGIGARSIEIRSTERLDVGIAPFEHKVNMTLTIPDDPDCLWRRLDKDVRYQVRKAERAGLTVETGGAALLAPFYDVFVVRMRELGSPVHARRFLASALEHFGTRARILLVRQGPIVIGGLIAIAFKDRLTVPWASCLKEHFSLCPNMLLYWTALRQASLAGFRRFEFGRSTRDSGTHRFKQQWGAEEEPLFWYSIPAASSLARLQPDRRASISFLSRTWQHLPLSLTRQVGPRLRGYLIQ